MTFEEWWVSTELDPITPREAWNAALEEGMLAIRRECSACGGTGGVGGGVHYVTHEMAMDAGEPTMEGMEIVEPPTECEYCGRPIAVLRAFKEKP